MTNGMIASPRTPAEALESQAAIALLEQNRARRRVRRIIGWCAIPVLLIALLFVGKLLSMYAFAHFAIVSDAGGDAEGTVRAANGQLPANWFEQYKAPFNIGVGLASGDDLEGARARFEEALPLASGLEVCPVQENLTLVVEAMGDEAAAAGLPQDARTYWLEALELVSTVPEGCHTDEADAASSDPSRSMRSELATTEQRIREKLNPPESSSGSDGDEGDGQGDSSNEGDADEDQADGGPSEDQLDQIQDLLDDGDKERDARNDGDDGQGGGTDRPW